MCYMVEVPCAVDAGSRVVRYLHKAFRLDDTFVCQYHGRSLGYLALTSLIFVTVGMGPAINGTMTVVSVLFCIFMNFVELLVAFIQAYVFTMLSAVFIGLSRVEETEKEKA